MQADQTVISLRPGGGGGRCSAWYQIPHPSLRLFFFFFLFRFSDSALPWRSRFHTQGPFKQDLAGSNEILPDLVRSRQI
uniref:Uncharacterized protein n=1 Tax=Fagus sylvatica TaxID=28930 RepID=A0A2N9EBT1_FAGSY